MEYTYTDNITAKTNKSPGFLRRNISKFPQEIKKRAYQAMLITSSVWCSYQENHVKNIEMVQRIKIQILYWIKHSRSHVDVFA